jgi:hypothetical protein
MFPLRGYLAGMPSRKRLAVLVAIAAALVGAAASAAPSAQASRLPTRAEAIAIGKGVIAYTHVRQTRFLHIRVSTADHHFARADISTPGVGPATVALFKLFGWHAYDIGSISVGCKPPRYIDLPYARVRHDLGYAPCG